MNFFLAICVTPPLFCRKEHLLDSRLPNLLATQGAREGQSGTVVSKNPRYIQAHLAVPSVPDLPQNRNLRMETSVALRIADVVRVTPETVHPYRENPPPRSQDRSVPLATS